MSIVLQSSGGGSVTINEPTTASNVTATLPAATGTVMVSGNQPAFRAYVGSGQSMASGDTSYLAQFTTETFDTASCFNNTGSTVGGIPAYAFLPNVAGYYQVNAKAYIYRATNNVYAFCAIFKNGSNYSSGSYVFSVSQIDSFSNSQDIIYLNGTTDYIQVYVQASNTSTLQAGTQASAFSAVLVRAA